MILPPTELLREVKDYSCPRDIYKWLSTCKDYLDYYQRDLNEIYLKAKVIEEYWLPRIGNTGKGSEEGAGDKGKYSQSILSLIKDPSKQLVLDFAGLVPPYERNNTRNPEELEDEIVRKWLPFVVTQPCRRLILQGIFFDPFLNQTNTIEEEKTLWNSLFQNKRELVLWDFPQYSYIDEEMMGSSSSSSLRSLTLRKFPVLTSLYLPPQVVEVQLLYCRNFQDFSVFTFSGVQKLTIKGSTLNDLTPLSRIPFLEIVSCPKLIQLPPVMHTEIFILLTCPQNDLLQTKFPCLKSLKTDSLITFTLETHPFLKNCTSLEFHHLEMRTSSFPIHEGLQTLSLQDCRLPLGFSWLGNNSQLHHFVIRHSEDFENLHGFAHVASIEIAYCNDLVDISGLGGKNRQVYIDYCQRISDFSSLKSIPSVRIQNCRGFTNGFQVENVRHLSIGSCQQFCDPSMLGKVEHLQLIACPLESVEGLSYVPILKLYCEKVVKGGLDSLTNNSKLIFSKEWISLIPISFERIYETIIDNSQIILIPKRNNF